MRIQVRHETAYEYATPAKYIIQKLRLSPRSHDGQHVRRWRIEVDKDCRLVETTDAFGNVVHSFTLMGQFDSLSIIVEGEVETEETAGVIRGTAERLPLGLYLRETSLTEPDEQIEAYARKFQRQDNDRLQLLHDLLSDLHAHITFDTNRTDSGTTAAAAFELRHGVCQDFAHVFIAAARSLGIPARYIGGYLVQSDGTVTSEAGHAWAEAYAGDLGWVGFDPSNGVCTTDGYVRVAVGLDYLGAAPVRGSQVGGQTETLGVAVRTENMSAQQ
ncbi:transglutaminase family protein [Microbaculum marinum]|uniref:Transglutaminase family protein n=1 Tax=Microbaculum marinum TaxID=1764581 RepID=A0AAW9RRT4_9HYPH